MQPVRAVGYIPARMGASRFPGKPLVPIAGRPMLEHCYLGARQSALLDDVVVATCDQEIADWAGGLGIPCAMTSPAHERPTDRVVEAVGEDVDVDVIVLIQGDEPLVKGHWVDAALKPVLDGKAVCTNLMRRIEDEADFHNPSTIKVVAGEDGRALYFSRSPIPSSARCGFGGLDAYRQVCVFGFTRDALLEFSALAPTRLEVVESIDMLRYLEHGSPVHFVEIDEPTQAVDTPEDVAAVEALMAAAG
jgi:3-deoxy-manno-octulosonate cytidylyltransferase (CMP-KDO synthetase)